MQNKIQFCKFVLYHQNLFVPKIRNRVIIDIFEFNLKASFFGTLQLVVIECVVINFHMKRISCVFNEIVREKHGVKPLILIHIYSFFARRKRNKNIIKTILLIT